MPSEDATNFTVYNNYANNITDNNTNNNVFDSKETNDPNTTTNQVSRTTHKSVLPGLHSRTVASQQQRHKAEYWDLDNCYNADEYDDQNDINSNTLPHYPVAQEITRTQQGANVFEENYNDHCNEEEAPYNTPIAYTNSREGSNIRATSTTTTITPLRYSPREKDELESITNNKSEQHNDNNIAENKYCGRAKLANSRNIKNKHKTHDKTIEPQKEKLHVKETKILKENTHAIGPEVLLSLHSERDRQSLIDFVVDKEIANLSYMFVDCDDAIIRLANSKFAECVGTVTSSLLLRRLHDVLIWLQVDQSDRVMSELEKIKMNMTEKQIAKAQSLSLLPTSSSSLSSTQQLKKHTLPITSNEPLTKFNQRASLPMSMRKNNEQESSELFVFCKRITLQGKCPYNVLSNVNKENNDYINNNANESDNIQTKINKVTTAKNVDATNTISESSAANKECVGNNNNSTINKVNTATDKLVLDRNKEMHHLIQEH